MRPALSSTSTPNELMRRCLLRWQSERHSPAHRPPCRHLSGFSFNPRFLRVSQAIIHKGDTDLAYEISPMYRESHLVEMRLLEPHRRMLPLGCHLLVEDVFDIVGAKGLMQ